MVLRAPIIIGVIAFIFWPSQLAVIAIAVGAYLFVRFLCKPWLVMGKACGELLLTRHYLMWVEETKIPVDRIASIEEVRRPGTIFGRHVAVITVDGEVIPVRAARRTSGRKEDLCGAVRKLAFETATPSNNPAAGAMFLKLFYYVGRASVVVGVLCIGLCLVIGWRALTFVRTAQRATGTISKVEQVDMAVGAKGEKKVTAYYSHFRFQDAQGRTHEVREAVGSHQPQASVGDSVPVLYNVERPESAQLDEFSSVWGFTIMAVVILTTVGVLGLRFGRLLSYYERKIREAAEQAQMSG